MRLLSLLGAAPLINDSGTVAILERDTRLELVTSTLAKLHSTTELIPRNGAPTWTRTRTKSLEDSYDIPFTIGAKFLHSSRSVKVGADDRIRTCDEQRGRLTLYH